MSRLVNQRLLEVQSQVEELQKSLQEQGSKAEDVSEKTHKYMALTVLVPPTFLLIILIVLSNFITFVYKGKVMSFSASVLFIDDLPTSLPLYPLNGIQLIFSKEKLVLKKV